MRLIIKFIFPIATLIIGILASFFGTTSITNLENDRITKSFQQNSADHIVTIEQSLFVNLNALSQIRTFFDSSNFITRHEFKTLTSPYLLTNQHVQALEWIPAIKHSQRSHFETLAKNDGFVDFQIKQRSETGEMIAAPKKDIYYPVFYVEPVAGNEAAIGFDLGSNPARLAALNKSMQSAEAVATAPITLVQETGKQTGILVFVPIYSNKALDKVATEWSQKQRQENIAGFGLLVLRVGDLITSSINHFHTNNIVIIDDITDIENIHSLYNLDQQIEHSNDLKVEKIIDVAGRTWRITVFPEANTYLLNNDPSVWLIFLLGTIATLILSYYLKQMITREEIINQQVAQKTAELAQSEYKANIILDTAGEAIITIDSSGIIQSFNATASSLFGYKQDDAIGINYFKLLENRQQFPTDNLADAFDGLDRVVEVDFIKSDGTAFVGELTHTQYTVADEVMHSFFLRDISSRIKMEAEQRHLIGKLNESNDDLQRFAYVASHDLQEPLRMVCNFTELLEKEYGPSLDKDALSYMKISSDAARRMQVLVNDLLTFSKVGVEIDFSETVNCAEIVDDIKTDLSAVIASTNANISVEELPVIHTNTSNFTRIMQNLISNSLKYKKPDVDPQIDISVAENKLSWVFCVTDNGIGIDEQYFKQIFQPFKRLHNNSEFVGSGIGLAICTRIADRMGGKIWIESEVDQGSKFFFEIPKNKNNDNIDETSQ